MYLLDTDTLIYSLKGSEPVLENLARHQHAPLRISAVSLMELYYGAYKSERVAASLASVRRIESAFSILPVDATISETFGMMKADLESKGTPLQDADLMIAATALSNNLVLVTNNEKHFSRIDGLKLENWVRS